MNPVLRSAQSTPYIRSPTEIIINEKENSNECLSVGRNKQDGLQFNAGCSSSSSDLSQLMEIYNDLGDSSDFEEWVKLYKKQRLEDEKNRSFNSETNEGYLSDSFGNLITPKSCSTQSISRDEASNYANMNVMRRSMDTLPIIKEGFFALGLFQPINSFIA
jgi:hypothetical protein